MTVKATKSLPFLRNARKRNLNPPERVLLGMISLFLLALLALWIAWPYLQDRRADKQETGRLGEKVEVRRSMVARAPESPSAHEALGDVLRESGKVHNAIAAYQAALDLQEKASARGATNGGAALGGTGLEHKLRLTQQEADQAHGVGVAGYGTTLATRQQVCRRCGALNHAQALTCVSCGDALLADRFFDTWRRDDHRTKIKREIIEMVVMVHVVLLAIYFASWLPLEVQGTLGISATAVLLWRLLKRIGDGPIG